MTHALRADASKPYGDVTYADPGYQADSKKRYPIDSEDHCRAAWSYINQADNAAKYSAEHLASIKSKIRSAGKKYGISFADSASRSEDGTEDIAVRSNDMFVRSFALQDLAVRSGGDGRVVEAYAAVFDIPAEITDGQGQYAEVIERTAFDRAIGLGIQRISVFYNHGMNLYGGPSDRFSVPIGTPEEIRADGKGLLTVTRFAKTPLADEILEIIRSGGIAGYSFTGRLVTSHPNRPPRGGYRRDPGGSLVNVRRIHLGLQEYGPTPMPAYSQAAIVGVRAALRDAALREELRALLSSTPDEDQGDRFDSLDDSGQVADDQLTQHSVRQSPFARRLQATLIARGITQP